MAAGSDVDELESTKSLIKLSWNPLKIDGRTFSVKSIFSENTVEILIFDLNELHLYLHAQKSDELMVSFKASFR